MTEMGKGEVGTCNNTLLSALLVYVWGGDGMVARAAPLTRSARRTCRTFNYLESPPPLPSA